MRTIVALVMSLFLLAPSADAQGNAGPGSPMRAPLGNKPRTGPTRPTGIPANSGADRLGAGNATAQTPTAQTPRAQTPTAQSPTVQTPGPQDPSPSPAGPAPTVQYDSRGWPILPEDQAPPSPPPSPAPVVEPAPGARRGQEPRGAVGDGGTRAATDASRQAPGNALQLDSPLLEVFQATRPPGAFKKLGGVSIWWRITVYGEQGEVIGMREVTHIADSGYAERDRLEYADGRVYGRIGASVFAERSGMPFPNLVEAAAAELELFGLHWRLPWCFAENASYAVLSRDVVEREDRRLARVSIERRPPVEFDVIGPEAEEKPRDHFELVYEPGDGTPVEFLHRFARNRQPRRLLLEDWRDYQGVRLPYRRVYVDESRRQTTALEILRIEAVRTSEVDFRLR